MAPAVSGARRSDAAPGRAGGATSTTGRLPTIVPPMVIPSPGSNGAITARYTSPSSTSSQPPDAPGPPTLQSGSSSWKPVTTTSNVSVRNVSSVPIDVEGELAGVGVGGTGHREVDGGQHVVEGVPVLSADGDVRITDADLRLLVYPGSTDTSSGASVAVATTLVGTPKSLGTTRW